MSVQINSDIQDLRIDLRDKNSIQEAIYDNQPDDFVTLRPVLREANRFIDLWSVGETVGLQAR